MSCSTSDCTVKTLVYIVKTLKDVNGRGNFSKSIQYGTKLLSVWAQEQNPKDEWVKNWATASTLVSNSRKLGYLGMWLDMIEASRNVNWSNPRDALRGLSNAGNFIFYLFDNIVYLQKAKVSSFLEADNQATKIAMCGFWFSQLFGFIGELMDLQKNFNEERAAKANDDKAALAKVLAARYWMILNIPVRLGNLTYSANGWDLSAKVLGQPFSEKTCAYAGLIAGVLALYKNAHTLNAPAK